MHFLLEKVNFYFHVSLLESTDRYPQESSQ